MKKVLIIYHRVDFDGVFSGYITKKALQKNEDCTIETLGFNYGDDIPDDIDLYDTVYMVDISLPAVDMKDLYEKGKLVWIDHHNSQILESERFGYFDCPGIRRNGTAACELCWEYFNNDQEEPKLIQYIGTYDVFRRDRFSWEDVLHIQYGVKSLIGVSLSSAELVENLYTDEFFSKAKEIGKLILDYQRQTWRYQVKNYSFDVEVQGKYKAIAMLTPMFTSLQFDEMLPEYDMCLCINRKGPDLYNMSIYTNDDCDFDAGNFAKNVLKTGGGHIHAAGMTLTLKQFEEIISTGKLCIQ